MFLLLTLPVQISDTPINFEDGSCQSEKTSLAGEHPKLTSNPAIGSETRSKSAENLTHPKRSSLAPKSKPYRAQIRKAPEVTEYPPVEVRYQDLSLDDYSEDHFKTLHLTDDMLKRNKRLALNWSTYISLTIPGKK